MPRCAAQASPAMPDLLRRGTVFSLSLPAAVSDLEVEYSEEPGTLYYFKYPVAGAGPWLQTWMGLCFRALTHCIPGLEGRAPA